MSNCGFGSLLFAILLLVGVSGCRTPVCHDGFGEGCKDLPRYCKKRPPQTCNGCASDPNCGWCRDPIAGEASCQPGGQDRPATCAGGWSHSTLTCEVPPPPPKP